MRVRTRIRKARDRCRSILTRLVAKFVEHVSLASYSMIYRLREISGLVPNIPFGVTNGTIQGRRFELCGSLPQYIQSVDDLIGLLPVSNSLNPDEELPRVSREVFRDGEPEWDRITSQFVTLPIELVRNGGIAGLKSNDFILFIRERCYQELKFLCDFVIGEGRIGRIHGHPGTGKSITALYFAAHMAANRGWSVLWVHIKHGAFMCLHMKPDRSIYREIYTDRVDLSNLVRNFHELVDTPVAGQFILIDGLRDQDAQLEDLVEGWCHLDRQNRRLVWLSSDGVDNDENDCDASDADRATFHQWSWKLEEYRAAMENPEFRSNVSDVVIESTLVAKYFFAGGCARYMFGYSIADVKERICKAVRNQMKSVRAGPTKAHFELGSVHSLFSFFGGQTYEIVSQYAEEELVRHCGSEELICLARHRMIQQIPRTIGLLFESFVKHRAYQENQIDMIEYDSKGNGNPTRWIINGVEDFAPDTLTRDNCPLDTLMWPLSDQEPTIDALILTEKIVNNVPKRVVLFIQITIAEKHRADMLVLKNHMTKLEADVAEFYFVLPPEPRSRVSKFTVSPIANTKAMVLYDWPDSAQEIRSKVQVVTFPGWNV